MEMSPSGETGREEEGICPPDEGAAQMFGTQVWITACRSRSEEELLSVTLVGCDQGKEVDRAFSEKSEEVSVSQTQTSLKTLMC